MLHSKTRTNRIWTREPVYGDSSAGKLDGVRTSRDFMFTHRSPLLVLHASHLKTLRREGQARSEVCPF